jgi:hypothetical protein
MFLACVVALMVACAIAAAVPTASLWHVGRADAPLRIAIQAAPGSDLALARAWKETAEYYAPPEFTRMQFAFFHNWTIADHLSEEFLTLRGFRPHIFASLASKKVVAAAQLALPGAEFVSFPPAPGDPYRAEMCAIGHNELVRTARWLCTASGNRCAASPRHTDWLTNEVYFSPMLSAPMAFTISPITSFVETFITMSFGNEYRTKLMLEFLESLVPTGK